MNNLKIDAKVLFILATSSLIVCVASFAALIAISFAPKEIDPTQCSKLPTKQTLACTDCLRYGGEWDRRLNMCIYPDSSTQGQIPDEAYAACEKLSSVTGIMKCRECIANSGTWDDNGCSQSAIPTLPSEGLFEY